MRIDRLVGGTAFHVAGANGGVHWCFKYRNRVYDSYAAGFQHDPNDYWCSCYSLYQQMRVCGRYDLLQLTRVYKDNIRKFVILFQLIFKDKPLWRIISDYFVKDERSDTAKSLRSDWMYNVNNLKKV